MGIHIDSVKRVLGRYGNEKYSLITYMKTCSTTDPDDIEITSITETILSNENKVNQKEVDNTTIKIDDIKLYVDPSSFSNIPSTSSKITDGLSTYSILKIIPYMEGNEVALYVFYIRK